MGLTSLEKMPLFARKASTSSADRELRSTWGTEFLKPEPFFPQQISSESCMRIRDKPTAKYASSHKMCKRVSGSGSGRDLPESTGKEMHEERYNGEEPKYFKEIGSKFDGY